MKQWDRLCDKLEQKGYSALSEDERTWLNARAVIDATNDGGLISYFYNGWADNYVDGLRALETLDVRDVRALVERVAKLFGDTVPPDVDARNDIINSWAGDDEALDATLSEVDDALYRRFDDLEARLESFIKEKGLAT